MPGEKRQQYLLLLLFILLFVGAIWFLYPRFIPTLPVISEPKKEEVPKIDFSFLESPALKELLPFEEISPFEEKVGRENPFLPY